MGTKVQSKPCQFPGYCSMRDLNEDPITYIPSLFYGDKLSMSAQYYNGHSPSANGDASSGCEKDFVKHTMLEHEAIIKYQVYKLHRLYRIQRNLMEEIRKKELHRKQYADGASFSPGPSTSQITIDDRQRWHAPSFPTESSFHASPSVSGVEYAHLPFVPIEEHSEQADVFTSQNGGSLGHIEVLVSRPTKVRRKIFDLQLPADEYVLSDKNDKHGDEKISGSSADIAKRNCTIGRTSLKLLHCDSDMNRCQVNTSRFENSLRNNGLADLNVPLKLEETNTIDGVDSVGQSAFLGVNGSSGPSGNPKSQFLGLSEESLFSAYRGNGHGKDDMRSVSCGSQPEKLSSVPQIIQKFQNEVHNPLPVFWTERTAHDLNISNSSNEASDNKPLNCIASLHKTSTSPVVPSSSVAIPWSHSESSFEIPSSGRNQKSVSAQMYPCLNITAASSTAPNYTNGLCSEGWPSSSTSKSNHAFGFEYPSRNGSYHGSSSRSKGVAVNMSTACFDYQKYSEFKGVPEHATNLDLVKYSKLPNFDELKTAKYFNTDIVLSNGSSNKLVPEQGLAFLDGDKKHEGPLAALPWLRTGVSCDNGALQVGVSSSRELSHSRSFSISNKADSRCFSGIIIPQTTSMSCSSQFDDRKMEKGECSRNKIFGFPIFEKPFTSKNVASSLTSSLSDVNPSEDVIENRRQISMLDINMPCDLAVSDFGTQAVREAPIRETGLCNKDAKFRCQIDLNLSVTDEEVSLEPTPSNKMKMRAVIDLETLPVSDTDEDVVLEEEKVKTPTVSQQNSQLDAKKPQDELMMKAAEAIVAISLPLSCNDMVDHSNANNNESEKSHKEPLNWFVDTVTSFVDNLEKVIDAAFGGKHDESNEESLFEEIDIFESMTLKQMETKEEDYMPRPFVPESVNIEESGHASFSTRPRRGPARRGRQRRDFRRDILPGIATLSRHEVIEDLQTYGEIMRITGHARNFGLTRRNSTRGRGRRRK